MSCYPNFKKTKTFLIVPGNLLSLCQIKQRPTVYSGICVCTCTVNGVQWSQTFVNAVKLIEVSTQYVELMFNIMLKQYI